MRLRLERLRIWSGHDEQAGDIRIRRGRVSALGPDLARGFAERSLRLDDHLALPGLINCHDHLQLNLFPHLGAPPYGNFYEWAEAIYQPDASPVREISRVPLADRFLFGAVKNLIAGVTTVMHHDPYSRRRFGRGFPVQVVSRYGWSHSLGYSPDPARDYHGSHGPYVVHAAEGVDDRAAGEVDRLDGMGLIGPRTVLVHAVAVTPAQQRRLAAAGSAVIWCPGSNIRLYGRTAPVDALTKDVAVGLGTDSTLSGSPHLLDELRVAAGTGLAAPDTLLSMVTTRAAAILQLWDGRGTLRVGGPADLVVFKTSKPRGLETIASLLLAATPADVALVLVRGRPRLADPDVARRLGFGPPNARVAGELKWIDADVAALRRRIRAEVEPRILSANPLWALVEEAA